MFYLRAPSRFAAFFLFVSAAIFNCSQARAQLVQWPMAQGGNGHFYEVVSRPSGITWGDASLAATNRGGYLATITSAEENTFIFNLATVDATVWYSGYGPWLGGIQPVESAEPAGGWKWITGEPFTYKNWAPGQPNNNQNEDRIQFGGQANRSSQWNDISQTNTNYTRGFIVEYDIHPNSVSISIARKDANNIKLSWASRPNVTYTIEWCSALDGVWTTLTTLVGDGGTLTADDILTGSQKFYRCAAPQ